MRCSLRPATARDRDFVAGLCARCYRDVVVAQFGQWDEIVQRGFFEKKWDPAHYQIVTWRGANVGAIAVQRNADHVFLSEILIDPVWQNQGLGSEIVRQVIAEASVRNLPVRLQVLRKNRARSLYERLGFAVTGRTETHLLMEKRA